MNSTFRLESWFGRVAWAILFWLFFASCATTPKIDWTARVGNYTYDQAVTDFGPPDKSANLTDGTVVAEWLTQRGYSHGSFYGMRGWWVNHYEAVQSPDWFLRLIFAPGGKLASVKRVSR